MFYVLILFTTTCEVGQTCGAGSAMDSGSAVVTSTVESGPLSHFLLKLAPLIGATS